MITLRNFINDVLSYFREKITHVFTWVMLLIVGKGIEFKSLDWAKSVVFEPLKERGNILWILMVGNHDAYYKNTNLYQCGRTSTQRV